MSAYSGKQPPFRQTESGPIEITPGHDARGILCCNRKPKWQEIFKLKVALSASSRHSRRFFHLKPPSYDSVLCRRYLDRTIGFLHIPATITRRTDTSCNYHPCRTANTSHGDPTAQNKQLATADT